jgi:hypothetical protein
MTWKPGSVAAACFCRSLEKRWRQLDGAADRLHGHLHTPSVGGKGPAAHAGRKPKYGGKPASECRGPRRRTRAGTTATGCKSISARPRAALHHDRRRLNRALSLDRRMRRQGGLGHHQCRVLLRPQGRDRHRSRRSASSRVRASASARVHRSGLAVEKWRRGIPHDTPPYP